MTSSNALRRLWVLMATVFVDMVGFLMVLPLLPFYATRLGGDAVVVGLLVAIFAVAQLATAPLWGRLSDRYGRRPMIISGLLLSALAFLLFGFVGSKLCAGLLAPPRIVALLFLSRLVQGIGGGTTGVVQAYVGDSVAPEKRAEALGWITAAISAGVMIGPAIGSLAAGLGPAAPGLLAAGLCLANVASAWRWLPESHGAARRAAAPPHRPGALRAAMREVVRHPLRPAASLIWIYAVGMMAFMAMNGILALFLQDRFGITEKSIGYFYTFVGTISLVMRSLILGVLVRRFGELRVLRVGTVALCLGFALVPLAHGIVGFGAAIVLIPVGTALLFPATTSLVSRYAPAGELGLTMGVQQAFGGIARMAGPMWAGAAFQHLSPSAPFWISALLALAARFWAASLRPGASASEAPVPAAAPGEL